MQLFRMHAAWTPPARPSSPLIEMRPRFLSVPAALFVLGAASVAANPSERTAVWEWADVPRVVAIGDLHGSYDKLVQLLAGAELVDGELRWTGVETHLVVAGDFLDRGAGDRPVMDLLIRLQEESAAAGGRVHVLLGNHEAMNLVRETRHVHPVAWRDFAGEETRKDRLRALASASGWKRQRAAALRTFNQQFPRGYFARQKAFDREGEYGSWLLRQPSIVKLNGIVYLHGGLTEEFASLGVDGINRRVLDELRRHLEQRELLESAGIITPVMRYAELQEAARQALAERELAPEPRRAAQALLESANTPILGAQGPLWYRGNSFEDERIENSMLDRSLELVGAKSMVVAHSYTGGNRITSRFHGQLFRLDHGIHASSSPLALVEEHGEVLVLNTTTRQKTKPVRESPNGQVHPPETVVIPDRDLEQFLSQATVTSSRDLGRGGTRPQLVVLEKNGQQRRAIFKTVEEAGDASADEKPDRYQHEVAAYRLDRELGLGLVPVTVVRDLDGRQGSLQVWVPGAVDQEAADAYELELYKAEATDRQLVQGEVFDALIGNHGREPSDVLCLISGEQVFLIDHSEAFSLSPELPANGSAPRPFSITTSQAEALRSLDRRSLEAELGDLLSDGQIAVLLERRDKILGTARCSGPACCDRCLR